jgi:hypothetical protein
MIAECLTLLEAGTVLYSSCSDVFQSFACEERLMVGDEDIWKSKQPRKHVIGNVSPLHFDRDAEQSLIALKFRKESNDYIASPPIMADPCRGRGGVVLRGSVVQAPKW